MSDDAVSRPKPQYGEYATPDEVARIMGPDAPARVVVHPKPTELPLAAAVRHEALPIIRPVWDRVLTALLFGIAVWRSAGYLVDPGWFGSAIKTELSTLGYTGFTVDAYVAHLGEVYTAVDATLIVLAGIVTIRAARRVRPRCLFTVPLGFALLSIACSAITVYLAFRHDPAALSYLNTR